MKSLAILAALLVTALAAPVDPDSEVELVEPVNTNIGSDGDGTFFGGFPVVIVRTAPASRNPLGRNPFFGGTPFSDFPFNSFPDEVEGVGNQEVPVGGISSILRTLFGLPRRGSGANDDDEILDDDAEEVDLVGEGDDNPSRRCGFICTMLRSFGSFADHVEDEIREIHREMEEGKNEVKPALDLPEGDSNSTYTEETLEDGTIVRTNRTVVRGPHGVTFVISQTTNFGNENSQGDAETDSNGEDEPAPDTEADEQGDGPQDEEPNDDVPLLTDEFAPSDEENEVVEGISDGVDSGLVDVVEK